MTQFLIILDKETGGFKGTTKLSVPLNFEEFQRLCYSHNDEKLLLVTEKEEPLLWQLCRKIDNLQSRLNRNTDLDYFISELKDLIDRYEE